MRVLTSTRLAVIVMIAISILSLIGALIPQGKNAELYKTQYGELGSRIILSAGLDSVFKQIYYISLMGLLGLMLVACALRRLIRQIRISPTLFIESIEKIENLAQHHRVQLELDRQETTLHIVDILKRKFYRTRVKSLSSSDLIYGSKHGFAKYGSTILHLGLAVLLVGGALTARFGERFSVEMRVGDSFDFAVKKGDTLTVTLDDFNVEFDEGGRPVDYLCELEIADTDGQRSWKTVMVNKPLVRGGVEIYLESYRSDPSFEAGYILSILDKEGDLLASGVYVPCDQFVGIDDLGLELSAQRGAVPTIRAIDESGDLRSYPIYSDIDEAMGDTLSMRFVMVHPVPSLIVSLQVVKEPGQPVIIIGFIMILGGVFASLCLSHRQIWFIVSDEGVTRDVWFGGYSHKDQQGFLKEFQSIKATIDELL